MKITKRQLRRIIKEEAADCAKDYRLGTLTRQEYEDCLKRFEEPDDYSYRSYPPRKTSYVGADTNQDKIAAVQAAIATKPNNFLQSVLSQLQRGRGLSRKQNAIVKKILIKSDPEAAKLFEGSKMKITKKKLRRIIKEEKAKLLNEVDFVNFDIPRVQKQAYSSLEDLLMMGLPQFVDDIRSEEFATFEKVVMDAVAELKDRTVKDYSGRIVQ